MLLRTSAIIIVIAYALHLLDLPSLPTFLKIFDAEIFDLMNKMWFGIVIGIFFAGVLAFVPRATVTAILGKGQTLPGILRATAAGVLLDLCSHGILMVGMQLYKRGASLGQVMAFLIASPWNSLSLTLILWSLIGFKLMMTILILSGVVAVLSGIIFDRLVIAKILPENPYTLKANEASDAPSIASLLRRIRLSPASLIRTLKKGISESRMILRWIFFGAILSALIRTFVSAELFGSLFGPNLTGLALTLIFATILEVCSEGSAPVAADFALRAKAPGNAFAFLMTGVSTDYTEIMSIKETTSSWRISLFLPLVTLPQVIILSILLNAYG